MKLRLILAGLAASATLGMSMAGDLGTSDSKSWLNRGIEMYKNKNYGGALDGLTHMKEYFPTDAEQTLTADYYIAMCRYNLGGDEAIAALRKFATEHPHSKYESEIQFAIGNYYFYKGLYGESIREYGKLSANELNRADEDDRKYRLGYAELKLGNYDRAKRYFAEVSATSKYRNAAIFYDGYIAYAQGDYDRALSILEQVNKASEPGAKAQYYITQIKFHNREYSEVVTRGSRLLNTTDDSEFRAELHRIVGESKFNLGDDDGAKSHLLRYLNECKGVQPQRSALYTLGVIADREADRVKVIDYMNRVVGYDDAMTQSAYLYLGQAYVKQQNYNSAMIAFEKAMQMSFNRDVQETAFFNYAVAQSKGSRTPFGRSIENFENFINRYPNSRYQDEVEGYLVNAYIYGNDYHKAIESINRIKNPSSEVLQAKQYVLYNLGVEAYSNNNASLAESRLTDARKLGNFGNRVNADCAFWLGESQYRQGKYASAEKNFRSYITEAGKNGENYWDAVYNQAYSQFMQKKYTSARAGFDAASGSKSTLSTSVKSDALARIGDMHYYNKNYGEAGKYYGKAREMNPTSGDYALFQEAIMNGLQKEHSLKIAKLSKFEDTYPHSSLRTAALFEKAQAELALGKNDDASATFEEILRRYPESVEARKGLLQLAITFKEMGKEKQAIDRYKKVITKYPSSEEASLAVEDLKVIYSERNDMESLQDFLAATPNAPKIDVSELDRISFNNAEKAYLSESQDISKLKDYLRKYPEGAYVSTAKFYVAKDDFKNGNFDQSLDNINYVLTHAGDASFAEDALAIKGAILMKKGRYEESLSTYKVLAGKAAIADNRIIGHLGVMRAATELESYGAVVESADVVIGEGGLSREEKKEATLLRANAYARLGNDSKAVEGWKELSSDSRNIYGAMAAYNLAEYYYNSGELKSAEKALNNFIDEGTPHQYWLARGFILLADVYAKQGNDFEAKEYLESLKSNYPGTETEIFEMIDSRLEKLKQQ